MNLSAQKRIWLPELWIWGVAVACATGWLSAAAQMFNDKPSIEITHENRKARISFYGTLLSAETASGPWSALTNADTPYVADLDGPRKYFRAGSQGSNSIFASRSVAQLNLTGPFQVHFDLAFAGTPDGIFPPVRLTPYFDGILTMPGLVIPVSIRVRGNSSLQECPFAKLKFKVSKEIRPGTPFADAREIKIGSHCAEGGRGNIGRLRDQIAAFREGLAYEILELMDFIAPRVRRGRIEYHDTTPPTNSNNSVGWQLTREALILEDIEVVAERLGGRALTETEIVALQPGVFDAQLATDLQLFNALLGNWDYSLAWDSRGVWNTEVLELTNTTNKWLMPVAGDFDLASWVTGVARRSAPQNYHPELGDIERETRYELERIQKRVTGANLLAARQRFTDKRAAIESSVALARIDEEGRTNALRHVRAFYDALEAVR